MATYKEIQQYIKVTFRYSPKSCWIAHMKELCGLDPKIFNRRYDINKRVHPCPPAKQEDIMQAFVHFDMI